MLGKIYHNIKSAGVLILPRIMSWICGGKLERLAIFWHFTAAFQQRFPMQWGPFVSPCSTKPHSLCTMLFWRQPHWVVTTLQQADKLCQGVNKSEVIVSSDLMAFRFRCTASRPELVHQQSSWLLLPPWWRCIHSLPTVLNCTFSKPLGWWYYLSLCSFVGGLCKVIQARMCIFSL